MTVEVTGNVVDRFLGDVKIEGKSINIMYVYLRLFIVYVYMFTYMSYVYIVIFLRYIHIYIYIASR